MSEETEHPDVISAGALSISRRNITFAVSRSSGPGGQNVNKVSTRIELRLHASSIMGFNDAVAQRFRMLAGKKLTADGDLRIVCQQTRSLETNRWLTVEQLIELFEESSRLPKKRHATKPSRGSRRRRIEGKKRRSETKSQRSGDGDQ